ncbi:HNH endonuclease family protein [Pseudooceanicola sp. CBS1P-1]|uniref:DUF1524 domain-containing protein n=1 Tax=Pseudooceanicola albus TaxID=2692189 RepID=A0A6L7G7G5_9RHOB|nr:MULTISPECIES: HNH endonuclease family protein [Pseudooceanicola]MBT9385799.1 HNH endonuclease family protein [Pseudooceanicola endophyticus]MXN20031.1 DUF1524 domain-containing protein [Pseudooceanicola albus]
MKRLIFILVTLGLLFFEPLKDKLPADLAALDLSSLDLSALGLPGLHLPDLGGSHSASAPEGYERSFFGGWSDADHDCLDTRAELLSSTSLSRAKLSSSGCTVKSGKWIDPYTGKTFRTASDLDIDHIVPLKWAWDHGANRWNSAKAERFANDPANLVAASASANRSKGAKGPLDWMPGNNAYRCTYIQDFEKLVKSYGLTLSATESRGFARIESGACPQAGT